MPAQLYVSDGNSTAEFPYATPTTAAATIAAAIEAARDGAAVAVLPGDYLLDESLEIAKAIEVYTTAGPDATRLYKTKTDVVMLRLGHREALFHSFNFDGGRPNVVYLWDNGGTVSNCYIQNGFYTAGSGVGVRARAGLVTHCRINNNSSDREGKGVGVYLEGPATVENCLIYANRGTHANLNGGVYLEKGATIRNCTIAKNQAPHGGGVYAVAGATIENCIIYGNDATALHGEGDPDWYGSAATFRNNCTPIAVGSDCITAVPGFIDFAGNDYRLSPASPCVDAGVEVPHFVAATDFYGNPRLLGSGIDIGAHEVEITAAGCGIITDVEQVLEGTEVVLTGTAYGFDEGATLTYEWDFDGDGVADAFGRVVTNSFPPGYVTVGLSVSDGIATATVAEENLLLVSPLNLYVVPENPNASHPYSSWETAADDIQEAIDTAFDGSTVWLGSGLHRPTATVNLAKGVVLQGTNTATTLITPTSATRILYVSHPAAVVQRLTLTGSQSGVKLDRAGGRLSELVITNNSYSAGGLYGQGIWIYAGTVERCMVVDNQLRGQSYTAGIRIEAQVAPEDPPVLIENCLVAHNGSSHASGETAGIYARQGVVRNCTVVGNTTANGSYGAGIHAEAAATIENCIVVDNLNSAKAALNNWGGTSASFSYTCSEPDLGGTGCFSADPLFVDAGNYRLQAVSPCVDAGLTLEAMYLQCDLAGKPRVRQRGVDLGAYEYLPPAATVLLLR